MSPSSPLRTGVAIVLAILLTGCLKGAPAMEEPSLAPDPRDPASANFRPIVTVAVIDSGINVYHREFGENYDFADPATYITGYPRDVEVLDLTLDEPEDVPTSNRHKDDEDVWSKTKSKQLYRVNGTKIVGLIQFDSPGGPVFGSAPGRLPGGGHGTMTASRAAANNISLGGPVVRLVMVKGFTVEGIRWAADQPWIDVMSISSGVSSLIMVPFASNVADQDIIDAFQYAAHKKPFFASTGNGVGNAGLLGYPSWSRGASGVPDVISVGAEDNGKMSRWHNQHPYIVSDGSRNPSADDGPAEDVSNTGGGTSSATPYTAGAGAMLIWEARRLLGDNQSGIRYSAAPVASFSNWASGHEGDATIILARGNASRSNITSGPLADGVLTQQEFKDVLYHTALATPTEDPSDGEACLGLAGGEVDPSQVPSDVRFQIQGYGEVNQRSFDVAKKVLAGLEPNPARAQDDAHYARVHMVKATLDS